MKPTFNHPATQLAAMNQHFNPHCHVLVRGLRQGNPALTNSPGNELNPFSFYTWEFVNPQPMVTESDHATKSFGNQVSQNRLVFTAHISTTYQRSWFGSGALWLLDPTYSELGEIIGGIRLNLTSIRRKNLAIWSAEFEQQLDNPERLGNEGHQSQRTFSWG